jgi:hypothetical protein
MHRGDEIQVVWVRTDGDVEFCDSVDDARDFIEPDDVKQGRYLAAFGLDGTKYLPSLDAKPRRFRKDEEAVRLESVEAPDSIGELRGHLLAYLERHAPKVHARVAENESVEELVDIIVNAPSGWHDRARQAASTLFGGYDGDLWNRGHCEGGASPHRAICGDSRFFGRQPVGMGLVQRVGQHIFRFTYRVHLDQSRSQVDHGNAATEDGVYVAPGCFDRLYFIARLDRSRPCSVFCDFIHGVSGRFGGLSCDAAGETSLLNSMTRVAWGVPRFAGLPMGAPL